jgi:hypothetical protein
MSNAFVWPAPQSLYPEKKTKKKPKKKETETMASFCGMDPLTSNNKMIHHFEVTWTGIDKALVPGGMVAKDRVSIVEAAVDVAALPGIFLVAGPQTSEEVHGVTKAANSMLVTVSGKRAQLHKLRSGKLYGITPWVRSRRRQIS